MRCTSCKNKSSTEQCVSNVLKGFLFCGKHLKVKNKRLWSDVAPNKHEAMLVQKIWRGYSVRKLIKLSGEGVLKRSVCHNDEELVTMESKNKVNPVDYFSIVEADKVYWFDVCSINQWIRTNTTNPYTRQPLAITDRIRLRELCRIRRGMGISNLHQSDHSLSSKWVEICQIIEENGFFDMNHLFFQNMKRNTLHDFLFIVLQDLIAYASEHKKASRRNLYVEWVKFRIQTFNKQRFEISERVANTLLMILHDCKNKFNVCHIIVSALVRL